MIFSYIVTVFHRISDVGAIVYRKCCYHFYQLMSNRILILHLRNLRLLNTKDIQTRYTKLYC